MNYFCKNSFFSFLFFLFAPSAFAQSFALVSNSDFGSEQILYLDDEPYPMKDVDTEVLRIQYECKLGFEDEERGGIETDYVLQIGSFCSKFVSRIRFCADSLLSVGGAQLPGRAKLYVKKANFVFVEDCYYTNWTEKTMCFTGRLAADDFLYQEPMPEFEWDITNKCDTICSLPCRLAETEFRGRKYKAWFTDRLPSVAGPWKFQGLPGVILMVEDSEKTCSMRAVNIVAGHGNIIKTEYPYIEVTRSQYAKLRKQILENPVMFSFNHSSRSNWKVNMSTTKAAKALPMVQFLEIN